MTQSVKKKIVNIKTYNSNVDKDHRLGMAQKLTKILGSSYILYHKTQTLHWNVTGPQFVAIHNLTESQYEDMANAVDDIAERIRALGALVPSGLATYAEHSVISDNLDTANTAQALETLANDHMSMANEMRELVKFAEDGNDVYTADLLTSRIGVHEEAAWMLRASTG